MEPIQPQYGYLNQLSNDLKEHQKDSIFLKIVGSKDDRHVEVVKGDFWNFVASIASFLGFKKYDLTEISRVFHSQLQQLENRYDTAISTQNYTDIQQTAERIATFFAEQLKKDHFIKNFATDKELVFQIASWKASSQFHELFTKSTQALDNLETTYAYIFKKMLDVDLQKLSSITLQNKREAVIELTDDVIRMAASRHIGKGVTSTATLLGAVAEENTRCIFDIIEENPLTDSAIHELGAALIETSCILDALSKTNENPAVTLQAKRALLLLLLQEITKKMDDGNAFDAMLKGDTEYVGSHFSPLRLLTVQDDELATIRTAIENKAKRSHFFDKLLSELESHFEDLAKAKSQAIATHPTLLKASGESLLSNVYKRINDNWKSDVAPIELAVITHYDMLPFAKNAVELLDLRELLFAAESHIQTKKIDAKQKERRVLKNVETKLKPLWNLLGGPDGYQDSENRYFSKKRLMTITPEELEALKNHILQALKPLSSSQALDKSIQWQRLSVYERELKQIFVT